MAPVAEVKSEAASKSAPRSRAAVGHVARARTAYGALGANYLPGADGALRAPGSSPGAGRVGNYRLSREDRAGRFGLFRRVHRMVRAKWSGVDKRPCGEC